MATSSQDFVSRSTSMAGRVAPLSFYVASGVLFGLAMCLAVARTIIRLARFHRLFIDDGFLFLGVATLIGGTVLLFINVPLAYNQEQVEAGAVSPPTNFMSSLIQDERTQDAATVLISTTIYSVKFSFLFFFRKIISRTKRWYAWWWWTVLFLVIASAPILMFSDFIACPYTGEKILSMCVSEEALQRENAIVRASVALDVITDVLIISIPIIILWNVQMGLRKKAGLVGVLCLGIFMIICAIVRVSSANFHGHQVDVLWVLLWLEIEACVAVITVSVTAFRMLFTGHQTASAAIMHPTKRHFYENAASAKALYGAGPSTKASNDTAHTDTEANRTLNPEPSVYQPFYRPATPDDGPNFGFSGRANDSTRRWVRRSQWQAHDGEKQASV